MAAFGYIVYLLRVAPPFRTKELQRLSKAGDNDDDLLDLIEDQLTGMGKKYHRQQQIAEGFRIKQVMRSGRALFIRINKGPEGSPGETYDTVTNTSIETTVTQAQLSGLRAFFVIPENSFYGLLFVERAGVRNLKEVMHVTAIRPAADKAGVVPRVEQFAEAKDWQALLGTKQVLRVSEHLEAVDSTNDPSTPDDTLVEIIAEGGRVKQMTGKMRDFLVTRFSAREESLDAQARIAELKGLQKAGKDAFSVQDEEQLQALIKHAQELNTSSDTQLDAELKGLIPVDREEFLHKTFEITVGENRPERTFSVERNTAPQFVYETNGRLGDTELVKAWTQHATTILANRGVKLPSDWNVAKKKPATKK